MPKSKVPEPDYKMAPTVGSSENFKVAALYKFSNIEDPRSIRVEIEDTCSNFAITGALIIAQEGINGTIAASEPNLDRFISYLVNKNLVEITDVKYSWSNKNPFYRMRVTVKSEIVTMGVSNINPCDMTNTRYLNSFEWNDLINSTSEEETIVVDTRNNYEVKIGSFRGAVNPGTKTFREFPAFVAEKLTDYKDKNVAIFCTGGIRCEKAAVYLESQGFQRVFNLRGGILKYLEDIPPPEEEEATITASTTTSCSASSTMPDISTSPSLPSSSSVSSASLSLSSGMSLWEGECFVFDQRTSVIHGLKLGNCQLCRGCKMPLTAEERESAQYVEGVSCPHCAESVTASKLQAMEERNKQISLCKQRNVKHLGYVHPGHQLLQKKKMKTAFSSTSID